MSEISLEETYYIRAHLMYKDLTREVLLKAFTFFSKSEDIAKFLSSADQQNKLREIRKRNILNETDYYIVSGHVLNLERLDISLLIRLISNLFKDEIPKPKLCMGQKPQPRDDSFGADLLRLRDVRNKIIGHRVDAKMSEAEYEHTWEKVKTILLRVVEHVDPENIKCIEQRLEEYKQLTIDTEDSRVKKLLIELLYYKKEIDIVQEKIEMLAAKSKELQVYFKTTPEQFVRYIKLLFEGGPIVLCGVLERVLDGQNLSDFLVKWREMIEENIEGKFIGCLYPEKSGTLDHTKWDIYLLASILLLIFQSKLDEIETESINYIKTARTSYADYAISSLDANDFLTIWTDLINSLKDLSISISKEKKLKVKNLIEVCKKQDGKGCNAEEYLHQLRQSGIEVKTLNDVYNETTMQLREQLRKISQEGIKFKQEHALEMKILTTCENEDVKKRAEDLIEISLKASLQGLEHEFEPIGKVTDKLVASITAHPDVKSCGVIRKCIIWSFKLSSPSSVLHILDYFQSKEWRYILNRISSELHYMYGNVILLQGHLTLESVSRLIILTGNTKEVSSDHISIPLKCSSVDGIMWMLSKLKREKTTNLMNMIAEQISTEIQETVSVNVFPDLMEFRDVFDETDSSVSSSFSENEEEIEEMHSDAMEKTHQIDDSNNKDNGDHIGKQAYFETSEDSTRAHYDEVTNTFSRSYLEDDDNVYNGRKVKHMRDKVENENVWENEVEGIDSEEVKETLELEKVSVRQTFNEMFNGKEQEYTEGYNLGTVFRFLKEGLKGVVSSFSQRDFLELRSKVLKNQNTNGCNGCLLSTLLPAHRSVSSYCPLGQEHCICISMYTTEKTPCPGNYCDVMHDEIIKRHRYSSVDWFSCEAYRNTTISFQDHWEVAKYFFEDRWHFNFLGRQKNFIEDVEDLEYIDLLDIVVNNMQFQKEISCQIDPPFDVLSKARIYLLYCGDETNEVVVDDMVNDALTILTDGKSINKFPGAQNAVHHLLQLKDRSIQERILRTPETESLRLKYLRRGCERESVRYRQMFPCRQPLMKEDRHESSVDAFSTETMPEDFPVRLDHDVLLSLGNGYDQLLSDTETTVKMMADCTKNLSESELLDLQDTVEFLIQTSESLELTSLHKEKLSSVNESFQNVKISYLLSRGDDWEYEAEKQAFKDFMYKLYRKNGLSDLELDDLDLYSRGGRIREEKEIFLEEGKVINKNIIVTGSKASSDKLCQFIFTKWENCYRYSQFEGHADTRNSMDYRSYPQWEVGLVNLLSKSKTPLANFEFVFIMSLEGVNETHIHNMIKTKLLAKSGHLPLFEQIIFRESEKCLIILQGLDKWNPDAKTMNSSGAAGSCQLPQRNRMSDYVVLLTTEEIDVENMKLGRNDKLLFMDNNGFSGSETHQKKSKGHQKCALL